MDAVNRFLFTPVPMARIAVYRVIVYLFIVVDLLLYTPTILDKADVPVEFYQPLWIARVLPIFPEPTHLVVWATFWSLLILAPIAALGRFPRLLGWVVFALYFEWMLIAMSYGKVDHDRFAYMLALAMLPTLGRARFGDLRESAAAGWAMRMVQMGAIATYFFATVVKFRRGGVEWLWGSTYSWAVLRRGTWLSNWTLDYPLVLKGAQFATVAFELMSPLIFFLRAKWQYVVVAGFFAFHLMVFLALGISFAPHLIALMAFLPLEVIRPVVWGRRLLGRPSADASVGSAVGSG